MAYARDVVRVYANESRYASAACKGRCRDCDQPITWFVTVANGRKLALDGHEPVPLRSERDRDGHTIEIHERATLHVETCPRRTK